MQAETGLHDVVLSVYRLLVLNSLGLLFLDQPRDVRQNLSAVVISTDLRSSTVLQVDDFFDHLKGLP